MCTMYMSMYVLRECSCKCEYLAIANNNIKDFSLLKNKHSFHPQYNVRVLFIPIKWYTNSSLWIRVSSTQTHTHTLAYTRALSRILSSTFFDLSIALALDPCFAYTHLLHKTIRILPATNRVLSSFYPTHLGSTRFRLHRFDAIFRNFEILCFPFSG